MTQITPLVGSVLPMNLAPWQLLNTIGSFAIFTLLFALIYKFLPDTRIAWNDVWVGALITSTLFSIGKWALGYYLGHSSFGSAFGAAGSLVFIVAWVFYSAQILFFGAEFTQVYATEYGSYIRPREGAIALAKPEQMPQEMAHAGRLKKSEQVDVERSIAVQAKLASVPRLRQLGVSAAEIAEALEVPLVEVEQVLQRVQ
ncbi:MAG TPA: YhjD/YihY/BrkB family envelope integrity protein [Stenomitos sp.]